MIHNQMGDSYAVIQLEIKSPNKAEDKNSQTQSHGKTGELSVSQFLIVFLIIYNKQNALVNKYCYTCGFLHCEINILKSKRIIMILYENYI